MRGVEVIKRMELAAVAAVVGKGSPKEPEGKCDRTEWRVWVFCRALHKKSVWTLSVWLSCIFRFSPG